MDLSHTPDSALDAVLAAARQSHARPTGLSAEARDVLNAFLSLSAELRETLVADCFKEKQARKGRTSIFREL